MSKKDIETTRRANQTFPDRTVKSSGKPQSGKSVDRNKVLE
jgi:hypothetical protein